METPAPERTVWLVIPSFNDAERLTRFLPNLCATLREAPLRVFVQVVDDGSAPAELAALAELIARVQSEFPGLQPLISLPQNQGKGAAILRGWEAATDADWLGFVDADGAVSEREVRRLIEALGAHPDPRITLFASRVKMRGRTVQRSMKRHLLGRLFATLVGVALDPGVYDSQCGGKFVSRAAYTCLAPWFQEKQFAFDIELLALLNHFNFPVEEVPVDWFDVPGSKVHLLRDSLRMACAVRSIRARLRKM